MFSKANPNLLAVVGQTGISFVPISKDGKLQRMVDSNFDRSEPIAKFVWSSKNKNKFAFATGCTVHIAKISDNGSLKTSSHFTVRIAKEIRDF